MDECFASRFSCNLGCVCVCVQEDDNHDPCLPRSSLFPGSLNIDVPFPSPAVTGTVSTQYVCVCHLSTVCFESLSMHMQISSVVHSTYIYKFILKEHIHFSFP